MRWQIYEKLPKTSAPNVADPEPATCTLASSVLAGSAPTAEGNEWVKMNEKLWHPGAFVGCKVTDSDVRFYIKSWRTPSSKEHC